MWDKPRGVASLRMRRMYHVRTECFRPRTENICLVAGHADCVRCRRRPLGAGITRVVDQERRLAADTCASAAEFLSHPNALTPGCLIQDVSLPGLNGFDVQSLVADRPHLPVIFITGCGDIPMTVRAMKAGAVEFLTKPFEG